MSASQLTFEALVNAYSSDLYRYACWMCKDSQLAEDLVQESFMRAWRALDKLENPESAKAWLFTILRREMARHFGRVKSNELPLDTVRETAEMPGMAMNSELGKVEHWALNRALKSLPHDYLDPLLLQVIGGYSCEEIGTMIGLKPGSVMTRVCRARQQLRRILDSESNMQKRVDK